MIDLDALEAALYQATSGEWFTETDGIYNATRSYLITPTGDSPQDRTDAEAIVAVRNAGPDLIAELREIRTDIAAVLDAHVKITTAYRLGARTPEKAIDTMINLRRKYNQS